MSRNKASSRGYSQRPVDTREVRQRFLIVCEGEETEPNYFKSFHAPGLVIKVQGLGKAPDKLVQRTKEFESKDDYDQVWCVFDRDSWTEEDFNNAIKNASNLGFKVAYSNEAFELWYILHFEFLNTGISRSAYKKKLGVLLGYKYQKNSKTIYDELLSKQSTAIKNAQNLLKQYESYNPARNNPSTEVHKLVEELNKFVQ